MQPIVDLTNCDKEPIHIPGKIQSHGFLLAIKPHNLLVQYASANAQEFLGKSIKILSSPIQDVLCDVTPVSNQSVLQIIQAAIQSKKAHQNGQEFLINGKAYYAVLSFYTDLLILEFSPVDVKDDLTHTIVQTTSGILLANTLTDILQSTVKEIKGLIDYDRVMMYKFLPDGSGEVVAEAKAGHLPTWLGLRYPESDIPKQARELYKINEVRLIADVNDEPVPILSHSSETIDLTCSVLRAVSPIHIQYLKNMQVASSFSVSVIIDDQLWGLIACHNYTPKFVDYRLRMAAKLLGQICASAVRIKLNANKTITSAKFDNIALQFHNHLAGSQSIIDAIKNQSSQILQLTNAGGAVVAFDGQLLTFGNTPPEDDIKNIVDWVAKNVHTENFYTNNFVSIYPAAQGFQQTAAGMLVTLLNRDMQEMIIWFKPERVHTINWAGKPEKIITSKIGSIYDISPRKSFELWTEQVKNTSDEWLPEEINSAEKTRNIILESVLKKSKELQIFNARLKEAYDELDTFTYTVSHDLKTPLTVMRTYAQHLLMTETENTRGRAMAQKIVSNVDRMNDMIKELLTLSKVTRQELKMKEVDVKKIVENIITLNHQAKDYSRTQIIIKETPPVMGDPLLVHQVFSNIIENALKYSSKEETPRVEIFGERNEDVTTYAIIDNGIGINDEAPDLPFELFKRLDNTEDFEGTGVGLAIVKRIMQKHNGEVTFTSKLNIGSTFYVSFPSIPT